MNICKKTHNARYFDSVEEIPEQIWHGLNCTTNVYFNPKYLLAIAKNHPKIQFSYIVLFNEDKNPIAFSTIQIVDFHINSVESQEFFSFEKMKYVLHHLRIISPKKDFKILTCGNTFVSGEHGIFIKNSENKQAVIQELAKSVVDFVKENPKLNKQVKAYMLKDFEKESLFIADELYESNYYSFNIEPNMHMHLDADWGDFDDYLAAMKTKFRVKAKKAMKLSLPLETTIITEANIDVYLEPMTALYKNVISKAAFNLGTFNLATYKELKNKLGEDYIILAYTLNSKVVGFLSGMVNKNMLDAHFVGIDYQCNRTYAIYQRILYDYVKIAIQRKLMAINFGRTASEIKSSIGAVPQDLTIYLRHKKSIPNKFLSLFLNKIQPTPFNQKHPFKAKNFVEKT